MVSGRSEYLVDLVSEIHDWLAPTVNFRSIQIDTFKKRTAGTGKWLLEGKPFQQWLDGKGGILWGTGIAGAGKSVVASIVVDHLETFGSDMPTGDISVAYAYSRYTELISVEEILGGLLDQQMERYPALVQLVKPLYKEHQNGRTKPTQNELVDLLVHFSKVSKRSFYVLDGIDEAPRDVQFNLVEVLRLIDANVFITSRPLENLESELPEAVMFKVIAHEDDIILLIARVIARNPDLRRLLSDPVLNHEVTDTILERSARMFLHAALQLEALQDCLSISDVRTTLNEMPVGVDSMYAVTVVRIEQQSAKRVSLAKRILIWVLHAEQPLRIEALQYAVASDLETHTFDPDRIVDEKSLLSVCCGLIYVERESGYARLIHFTAKDALEPILLKDFPSPHAFLASTCISCLISHQIHESDIQDVVKLDNIVMGHSFLFYAYHFWNLHAHKCDPLLPMAQPIRQFLERCQSFPLPIARIAYLNGVVRGSGVHVASALGLLHFLSSITDPNTPALEYGLTPLMLPLSPPAWQFKTWTGSAVRLLDIPGIDVNTAETRSGSTALILASSGGYEDVVDRLLRFPEIEVNATDNDGWTALAHAVKWGREHIVTRLLQHDEIDIQIMNNDGMTADMIAALYGHESMVRLLLKHSLEVQSSAWNLLWYASKLGLLDVLEHLLASADLPNNAPDEKGHTALILASFYGHEPVVQRLLEHPDIQVNLVSRKGYTALIAALERGHTTIARRLLQVPGIEVNHKKDGTAVHYALRNGYTGLAQELLRRPETDVNALDKEGQTALMLASYAGYTEVVEQLLACPAIEVNTRDTSRSCNAGWTALILASYRAQVPIVDLLLQHPNTDVNHGDDGMTALITAAQWGGLNVVQRLLQHPRIDVNASADDEKTALMWASAYGRLDVVEALLQFPGIDVNVGDRCGRTALMEASYYGRLEVVNVLLGFLGIRLDLVDEDAESALSLVGRGALWADDSRDQLLRDALLKGLN